MLKLRMPRLTEVLVISVLLFIAAALVQRYAPGNILAVSLYKMHMVSIAGWCGYWLFRFLEPYGRPHSYLLEAEDIQDHGGPAQRDDLIADCVRLNELFEQATLRRTIIVAACVIGICLGA